MVRAIQSTLQQEKQDTARDIQIQNSKQTW